MKIPMKITAGLILFGAAIALGACANAPARDSSPAGPAPRRSYDAASGSFEPQPPFGPRRD